MKPTHSTWGEFDNLFWVRTSTPEEEPGSEHWVGEAPSPDQIKDFFSQTLIQIKEEIEAERTPVTNMHQVYKSQAFDTAIAIIQSHITEVQEDRKAALYKVANTINDPDLIRKQLDKHQRPAEFIESDQEV
jgi:hypothetical protein